MRTLGFHVNQSRGFAQRALRTEDETVAVVRTAIGHVVALWTADFITGEICGGKEFDFGHDYCFVAGRDGVWGGVFELVGGYEKGICRGMEDASLVEVWGAIVID